MGFGGSVGTVAGTYFGGPIGGMAGAALGGAVDSMFASDESSFSGEDYRLWRAERDRISGEGKAAINDPGMYYNAERNFGQETAQGNMERYGFQGVYQKFLQGESQRLKDDAGRRIMRLASSATPGMSSFVGGAASQGLGGSTSNVLGRQHRQQAMGQAMDRGFGALEEAEGRLDSQFLGLTGQNEQMRFGASQDFMRAQGASSEAGNLAARTNTNMRAGLTKNYLDNEMNMTSQEREWSKMRMQGEQAVPPSDSFGELGAMAGQYAGMSMYKDMFPAKTPISFNSATNGLNTNIDANFGIARMLGGG